MVKKLLGQKADKKSVASRQARLLGKFTLGLLARKYLNFILALLVGALTLILLAKYVFRWI